MKKLLKFIPAAAILLAATACDSKSRLADDITGTWSGTPEMIANETSGQTTVVNIIDFERTPGTSGGTMTLSALLTTTSEIPESDKVIQPISYSASGVATIRGEWIANDDDKITVAIDPTSMSLQVDPDAVQLNYNVLSETSSPDTVALNHHVIAYINQEMKLAVQKRFFKINKIDDIKIKDNMMSCEINDRDLTLRRQTLD